MISNDQFYFGGPNGRLFYADGQRHVLGKHIPGIRLPDGMWISYPGLREVESDREGWGASYAYDGREDGKRGTVFITGPKVAENITQALATCILKWQALQCSHTLRMQTHDENVIIVNNNPQDIAQAIAEQERWMKTAPPWIPDIPLGVATGVGSNYGDT
jgi:hypothetical protein